jgi:hypothetical protein
MVSPSPRSGASVPVVAAALVLLVASARLAAQVEIVEPPTPTEQAAGEANLRGVEERAVVQLRRTHGDPRFGRKLGANLRSLGQVRLPRPSAEVRAAVAAASDPTALAMAIAGTDDSDTDDRAYDLDVLLTAFALPASEPHRAQLLAKAAAIERDDTPLRLAFLQRAAELVAARAGDGPAAARAACRVASWRLGELLAAGLAHEAVAYFSGLAPSLRAAVEGASCGDQATIEGTKLGPDAEDLRLGLVSARWLDGDPEGARALLAKTPGHAWRPGAPGTGGDDHATTVDVWRAVLEHALAHAAPDDGFSILAEFAGKALLLTGEPGPQVWGVGILAYARAATQARYPELAFYAWEHAPRAPGAASPKVEPLPPDVAAMADAVRRRLTEERARASAALLAAGSEAQRANQNLRLVADGKPFVPAGTTLIAVSHDRRQGIVLCDHWPYYGHWYRLEARDGTFEVVLVNSWIS